MKDFLIKNKVYIVIAVFILLSIFVSYYHIGYNPELKKDAKEYYEAASFLANNPVNEEKQLGRVLTTPLFLYTSIFVNFFVNDYSTSFSIVNIIFYFLCIFAFYFLALEIYKESKVAFLSTILVVFNFYVIDPGNAHLADMGGWFFFILSTFLAIRYINTLNRKFYYLSIFFTAIGVLFKEYGGLALCNLALLICIGDFPWKQKIKDISLATLLVLLPLLSFFQVSLRHHV